MNICVVGTGYVGLVAGTCLADFGTNVTCVDKDPAKIDDLNAGRLPIYEPGLLDLIKRNTQLGRLRFTTDLPEAVSRSLVIFLAVGTPELPDGRTDLSQINQTAKQIAACMTEYRVLAIKSTVPVGTASHLRKLVGEHVKDNISFDIVSNPEFLREGAAVGDFLRPDRVVLGTDSERALAIMRDIYRPLYLLKKPFVVTGNETAELIKYAANTMLALRISFMNEIANLCDIVDADVFDIAVALGMDRRIGPKFLHPGPGFGGSCFPKDIKSLIHLARDNNYDFKTAEAVVEVNDRQRQLVLAKARHILGSFESKKVALLGLSFKPDTDDIRESPALHIVAGMLAEGAQVAAYDPAAMKASREVLPNVSYCDNPYAACEGADLVMILTEWNEFRDLDFDRIRKSVQAPNIFDTRNIYDPEYLRKMGFNYVATGRGKVDFGGS